MSIARELCLFWHIFAYENLFPVIHSFFLSRSYTYMNKENLQGNQERQQVGRPGIHNCFIDGSWVEPWQGGMGFVLELEGRLQAYCSRPIKTCSPVQTEARALLTACHFVSTEGITNCSFFPDCQDLAKAVTQLQPPVEMHWTASKEVMELWEMLKLNRGFTCSYICRDLNENADVLARKGRIEGIDCIGYTYPTLKM